MYRVTKPFKYSVNGYEVETIEPDEYRELDPGMVRYAQSIGALEGSAEPKPDPGVDEQPEDGPAVCRDQEITEPKPKKGKKK